MNNIKYFKKNFLIIAISLIFAYNNFGQQLRKAPCNSPSVCQKNTFFHEIKSNLSEFNYNSINFEHLISCGEASTIGLRFGLIYFNFYRISALGVPLELNYMRGRYNVQFEIGGGITAQQVFQNYSKEDGNYEENIIYTGLTGRVGVRYQKPEGGLFLNGGFTPMLSLMNYKKIPIIADNIFIPMFALGIGYTFK